MLSPEGTCLVGALLLDICVPASPTAIGFGVRSLAALSIEAELLFGGGKFCGDAKR